MYALQRSVSGRENQLVETCVSVYSGPVAFLATEGFSGDLTSLGKSTSACPGLVSVDEGTLRGFRLRSTAGLGEEGVVKRRGIGKHVRRKKIRRRRRRWEHRRMRERGVGCR